jgi:hypothetical protein
VTGYEDPVLAVRTTQVFGEDIKAPEVTELVPITELTPEMREEISKTVKEKLMAIPAGNAQ